MQQERQLRRRQQKLSAATGNHVTRGRLKIRSPALPFTKWELRVSPNPSINPKLPLTLTSVQQVGAQSLGLALTLALTAS